MPHLTQSDNSRADEILVYLPSPMGDAILATPALRRIRQTSGRARICFLAIDVVRQVLSPTPFCDEWLTIESGSPFRIAALLRRHHFKTVFLLSNSFRSALSCFLAGIPGRIGYARGGRSPLLTHKRYAPRKRNGLPFGRFTPRSMIDYYLEFVANSPDEVADRSLELHIDAEATQELDSILPQLADTTGPLVILVPGGAFGPSKCWLPDRFAKTADYLISSYGATVVISVADNEAERQIARSIQNTSSNSLISLADTPLPLALLKALYARAELVITNDTGPRHIAIALQRKVITLFGPNDPAWTETGYEGEIKIVAGVPCAPCAKPICPKPRHICMQSITVNMVTQAADRLLKARQPTDASK